MLSSHPPFRSLILPLMALGMVTSSASAAILLVSYDIESSANRDASTNVNTTLLASASDLSYAGVTTGTSTSFTNANTGTVNGGTASMGTAAGTQRSVNYTSSSSTFSKSEYMTFTLTPKAGGVQLDKISFDFAAGGSGNRFFALEYSFDGFANFTALGSGTSGNNNYTRATFDLANQNNMTNLTTSPVAFRFYGYREGSSTATVRFDNIQVTAVPEPSVALLGALGALALFRRRR